MQARGRKLKNEALGPALHDIKLRRLEKGLDGNKAYAINILLLHIRTTRKACK